MTLSRVTRLAHYAVTLAPNLVTLTPSLPVRSYNVCYLGLLAGLVAHALTFETLFQALLKLVKTREASEIELFSRHIFVRTGVFSP